MGKFCIKCQKVKEYKEFSYRKDTKKYRNECKNCLSDRNKTHYLNNRKRLLEKSDIYYKENRKKRLKYAAKYRGQPEIIEKTKKYDSKYRKEHKKERKAYLFKHRVKLKEHKKQYRIKNGISTGTGQTIPEKFIQTHFKKRGFTVNTEFWFEGCRNKQGELLFFDFYIPYLNLLVEFDGPHHFKPIFGEATLKKTKLHDKIKNDFCKANNITLLRISYKQDILTELRKAA